VAHLREALSFCVAIEDRGYLAAAAENDGAVPGHLRRLRCHARHLVVALLLERLDEAAAALARLRAAVAAYNALGGIDVGVWRQTLVDAEGFVAVCAPLLWGVWVRAFQVAHQSSPPPRRVRDRRPCARRPRYGCRPSARWCW
jgi:hypothetical protein